MRVKWELLEDSVPHQQQLDITQGLEFTSLHSTSDDGLTANGEETRGPRAKNPEPGRTYECEVWCREASRQLAGCLGFTVLVLTYAVSQPQKWGHTNTYFRSKTYVSCHDGPPGSAFDFVPLLRVPSND